jgi:adenosylhomocysteinase
MINLTAGHGDSLNSFDTTLALMTRVLGHMVRIGTEAGAGLNAVPDAVWQSAF